MKELWTPRPDDFYENSWCTVQSSLLYQTDPEELIY